MHILLLFSIKWFLNYTYNDQKFDATSFVFIRILYLEKLDQKMFFFFFLRADQKFKPIIHNKVSVHLL